MKILQVHNKYKKRGGEESVLEEEKGILEAHGHEVVQYLKDSHETDDYSVIQKVRLALSQRKSKRVAADLRRLIEIEQPDICHVHNIYPLISPVVFEVCSALELPVVQTLHNYKLLCTNSLLFREGHVCELCLNKSLYQSVPKKCYRDSLLTTAFQADAIQHHRDKGTWQEKVDRFVCLTEFQRDKLVEGGLPAEKMYIKPNFVRDPEMRSEQGDFFLFVGRLDASKGLADLISLFEADKSTPFVLIGTSDEPEIFDIYDNVNFMGSQSRKVVMDYMRRCRAVLFPSHYYEGMPMVILEAFSLGKPVIAHNVGAMSSMIEHGKNGHKYRGADELAESVKVLGDNLHKAAVLGQNAREEYEQKYTAEAGYRNLIALYNDLLKV